MKIVSSIKGLYALGGGVIWASVKYGLRKRGLDKRYEMELERRRLGDKANSGNALAAPPKVPVLPPGACLSHEAIPDGVRVVFQRAELETVFLAPDVIRLTWTPGAPPVGYATQAVDWRAPDVGLVEDAEGFTLQGADLTVVVSRRGGVDVLNAEGRVLYRAETPMRRAESWQYFARLLPEEHVYGLGQRNRGFNLRGGGYLCYNLEAMGDYGPDKDPIYVNVPAYLCLHERGSYLAYHDTTFPTTFGFHDRAEVIQEDGACRVYLMFGTPRRCLELFTDLTGKAALPPRWALGYHQARWSYLNDAEVREVLQGFKDHDMPISSLHMDIHYMNGYRIFTNDPKTFPDMPKLCADMKAMGVHPVVNTDPAVKQDPDYEVYRDGQEKGVFCTLPDGSELSAVVWPGFCAFPDFTNPVTREWWAGWCRRLLVEWGLDGIWLDMNEPSAFSPFGHPTLPLATRHSMDGRGGDHREAHNVYGLLENRATFEGFRRHRPEIRPWILSRSGFTGLQRTSWNWTGDCASSWWSLANNIRLALMLGVSGIPYTGSDIGGFNGEPDPELFLRWFQTSAFMPFFRVHSAVFVRRREPWSYGEPTTAIARDFMRLRYRLLPYWYHVAKQCTDTGAPLLRPLWWDHSAQADLWDEDDAYLLGDDLLVAPVLQPGVTSRSVTLPPGVWYDFWTDLRHEGPGSAEIETPLERIPLLVRAGAILPMEEGDTLTLHAYPAPSTGSATLRLYSDSGDGYAPGRYDVFTFARAEDGDGWLLRREAEAPDGAAAFPWTAVRVALHGGTIVRGETDGATVTVENGAATLPAAFTLCRIW